MTTSHWLADSTWPDVAERAANGAILAIPVGSTEQHGPHLPLSTDTDIAVALCVQLAERRGDILIAPPLAYGSSGEHAGFAGTLSIGQAATELAVLELGRSASDTFARVLIVSAHGGNAQPVTRAVDQLQSEGRDVLLFQPRWSGDAHAGASETSVALALAPDRVRMERAEAGDVRPIGAILRGPARARHAGDKPQWRARRSDGRDGGRGPSPATRSRGRPGWLRRGHGSFRPGRRPMTGRPRVALVTGGARGIGAATACALAADGWAVVVLDRAADDPALPYPLASRDDLEATVARANALAEGDGLVHSYIADVRDSAALHRAVEYAERQFGGLDAAIACAGVIAGGVPLWEVPIEQEQAVLDVNLGGVIALARAAIPALLRRPAPRSGRFLAVSSAAATRGLPMLAAYCAAKAGVAGLVRALAVELGDSGVTANAVSPGSTQTPLLAASAELYNLASAADFAAQQPIGRLLDPVEIATVLVFLVGAGSSAITGAVIPVDGGLAL